MRKKRNTFSRYVLLLGVCIWNSQELTSRAEEISPPGYHVYTTTEDEVIDTWYGIARGTYLKRNCGISGSRKRKS